MERKPAMSAVPLSPRRSLSPPSRASGDGRDELAALRARVRALEGGGAPGRGAAPLGPAALDARLPGGGLPLGGLHEVEGACLEWDDGAATGFLLGLLARLLAALPKGAHPVLWVSRWRDLYLPGLAAFGLDPGRLILVRAARETEVLWAMEEGLRCSRLAAVLGEVAALERGAGRRLQLAAEAGGVTAFALRRRLYPAGCAAAPSAATTRWRVMPAAAQDAAGGRFLGRPAWRVELLRCRGAAPGQWSLEWDDATGGFALAAPLRDRAAAPPLRRAGAAERRLAG